LPTLTTEHLIELLSRYVTETGATVDLLLVGALALQTYGVSNRATRDVDGELDSPLKPLAEFFRHEQIPADLTQNFSGWSIVAMPPGYRDRAIIVVDRPQLRLRVLAPIDFVLAKLRRGTDLDVDDALLVARRYSLTVADIGGSAQAAVAASPQDTALFLFQQTVDLFCRQLTL
jgi:hypothetical protein